MTIIRLIGNLPPFGDGDGRMTAWQTVLREDLLKEGPSVGMLRICSLAIRGKHGVHLHRSVRIDIRKPVAVRRGLASLALQF